MPGPAAPAIGRRAASIALSILSMAPRCAHQRQRQLCSRVSARRWRRQRRQADQTVSAPTIDLSLATALPGLVRTGRPSAVLAADAARDVEKCASSTAS